jgi:ankyrin repeat protein
MPDPLVEAIRAGDLAAVRVAIKAKPEAARHPRSIVEAARLPSLPVLQLLHRHGADLNASFRNYRPLHNLLQSDPHELGIAPSPERLACLDWMLAHQADPEQLAAWPAARAIVIAGFVGKPEYVKRLRKAGARMDGFAAAALGDRKGVEKALRENPAFARQRDHGVLTALHCAAGSRMPGARSHEIAAILIEAGASVRAKAKSWGHSVDALYLAAGTHNCELFEILIEAGADPDNALSHSVWRTHYDLAETAFAYGAEPDRATANGKPLLNDLIRWGQVPQVMWLLDRGASPNIPDRDGWTAVHQAVSRGNARLLKAVLDAGGDLTRRDREGRTPVDLDRGKKLLTVMG